MRKAGSKNRRTSPGVGFLASPNMDRIIVRSTVFGTRVLYQCEVRLASCWVRFVRCSQVWESTPISTLRNLCVLCVSAVMSTF